ncbi:uncharacterized protein LOC124432621 [Vespa crabro]|uniref:uncharacterized protein LOC124432621 n=1 Tax=Vespa crabro TaxID=7445 RepID=UPI001EFF945D|nr:uncharacterized protein LOC124432621 [Vespa crabro]
MTILDGAVPGSRSESLGSGVSDRHSKAGFRTQGIPQEARTLAYIVHTLFPSQPKREISMAAPGMTEAPQFTEEELIRAASSMRKKKAPSPDGLLAELIKAVAQSHPELLLSMPVCMLGTAGKLLEKLLRPGLHAAERAVEDLAACQYVFRSGLSTIYAIQEIVTAAKMTERGNHHSRTLCLLATLDVRNAINSVRWDMAMVALERNFRVPWYLLRILGDNLNERFLEYITGDGPRRLELKSGAVQGSIQGPIPGGAFLIGYADDIVVVITARDTEGAQLLLNQFMRRVISRMEDHGLYLAAQKTEVVLLTKKRINTLRSFTVEDATVQTKTSVRYLGVIISCKLTYRHHILRVADKATNEVATLCTFMTDVNGHRPCIQKLMMRAAEAVMLYGAEIWAEALRKDQYRKRMAAVQEGRSPNRLLLPHGL